MQGVTRKGFIFIAFLFRFGALQLLVCLVLAFVKIKKQIVIAAWILFE